MLINLKVILAQIVLKQVNKVHVESEMRIVAMIVPALMVITIFSFVTDAEARKRKNVRGGALYCQGDHLHYGSSKGYPRKREALKAAIKDWAGFTVFEYGAEWGHWRRSIHKSVDCNKNSGLWSCYIKSTPCRKAKRGERAKYQ